MMPQYGTGKPDSNQREIVEFLRTIPGCYVHVLSQYPAQLDLLVYYNRILSWWEIKHKGCDLDDLTSLERAIITKTAGATFVVASVADALRVLETKHGMAARG